MGTTPYYFIPLRDIDNLQQFIFNPFGTLWCKRGR
jgi:hypothetical protein